MDDVVREKWGFDTAGVDLAYFPVVEISIMNFTVTEALDTITSQQQHSFLHAGDFRGNLRNCRNDANSLYET